MIRRFEHGELFPESEWQAYVDSLREKTVRAEQDAVRDALMAAVRERMPPHRFGVWLSGGVDSSLLALLCKNAGGDFVCYCAGMEGSPDVIAAQQAAASLDVPLRIRTFSLDGMRELFGRTAALFDWVDTLRLGVGAVVLAAVELAKQDGISTFFGGLGSEELFGGYERHAIANDVNGECWRGLRDAMHRRDLTRDHLLAKGLGITVLVPFLDEKVILAAMGIPGTRKIAHGEKKVILREIAEEAGLPRAFAFRKKQAAQYGSWFDKALEKIAKKNGCATKEQYVKTLPCLSSFTPA